MEEEENDVDLFKELQRLLMLESIYNPKIFGEDNFLDIKTLVIKIK